MVVARGETVLANPCRACVCVFSFLFLITRRSRGSNPVSATKKDSIVDTISAMEFFYSQITLGGVLGQLVSFKQGSSGYICWLLLWLFCFSGKRKQLPCFRRQLFHNLNRNVKIFSQLFTFVKQFFIAKKLTFVPPCRDIFLLPTLASPLNKIICTV